MEFSVMVYFQVEVNAKDYNDAIEQAKYQLGLQLEGEENVFDSEYAEFEVEVIDDIEDKE